MKAWFNSERPPKSFFLFQYNRYENGYGDIYFRLWRFHLLIYPYKFVGKMKEGVRVHKTIKF